jgi:starvation-inducible DNA-binding protein
MFNTLHAMFMAQYTELWNAVDPIAERIRALGHAGARLLPAVRQPQLAEGRAGHAAQGAGDGAHPGRGPRGGRAHRARHLPGRDKASDEPTADLLTQRLTVHEQTAWMLRSLLEE